MRRSAPTPHRRAVAQRGRTRPRTVPVPAPSSSTVYRHPFIVLAVAAGAPRLARALRARGDSRRVHGQERRFAPRFLESGTYGFIPGIPSAYTQPLYGCFLPPLFRSIAPGDRRSGPHRSRHRDGVVVFGIGRRIASPGVGLGGALLATLHPYLVWHDVHLKRESRPTPARRPSCSPRSSADEGPSLWLAAPAERGAGDPGQCAAVAPPLGCQHLADGAPRFRADGFAACSSCSRTTRARAVGRAQPLLGGCVAVTTDSRALWKANDLYTYDFLARGSIDDVPPFPGAPPSPRLPADLTARPGSRRGGRVRADTASSAARSSSSGATPGRRLASPGLRTPSLATECSEDRRATRRSDGGMARSVVEPAFVIALYVLALSACSSLPQASSCRRSSSPINNSA